jgi:hypothetical protein
MNDLEVQEHLDRLNRAKQACSEAEEIGQGAYSNACRKYAEEALWFDENGIRYWHDQETGLVCIAIDTMREVQSDLLLSGYEMNERAMKGGMGEPTNT